MSVTSDIVASWRHPRHVTRRLLARGRSEPFALTFLLAFLLLALLAAAPNLARQAHLDASPLMPRLYASALGLLATIPLWYLVAALGHVVARAFGGSGGFYGSRLALFWSLLAMTPAMLVQGLVLGLLGPGAAVLPGLAIAAAFVVLWIASLREVEGL